MTEKTYNYHDVIQPEDGKTKIITYKDTMESNKLGLEIISKQLTSAKEINVNFGKQTIKDATFNIPMHAQINEAYIPPASPMIISRDRKSIKIPYNKAETATINLSQEEDKNLKLEEYVLLQTYCENEIRVPDGIQLVFSERSKQRILPRGFRMQTMLQDIGSSWVLGAWSPYLTQICMANQSTQVASPGYMSIWFDFSLADADKTAFDIYIRAATKPEEDGKQKYIYPRAWRWSTTNPDSTSIPNAQSNWAFKPPPGLIVPLDVPPPTIPEMRWIQYRVFRDHYPSQIVLWNWSTYESFQPTDPWATT